MHPSPPERSWLTRNWLWAIPAFLVLPPLLCAGCCGGFFFTLIGGLKQAPVFTDAVQRIEADDQVKAALGEPIKVDWFPFSGQLNAAQDANYTFSVSGPKGSATANFAASYGQGGWRYNDFTVALPNDKVVDLSDH